MKLENDEIICPSCNGLTWIHEKVKDKNVVYTRCCRHCNGIGKLNWLDNLIRRDEYNINNVDVFIIKNMTAFKILITDPYINIQIERNGYVCHPILIDEPPDKIFNSNNICKQIKEGNVVVYEYVLNTTNYNSINYNKMMERVMNNDFN